MALILRNGGSQSPDRWLKEPLNNHFYYHFKDIYDLVEWSCEEDSKRAADGNTTYDTWEQGFLNIFYAIEENKPFILNVYHYVSQEQITQYLYRVVYRLIKDVVEECAEGMSVREEDKKFIADFYKFAFVEIGRAHV